MSLVNGPSNVCLGCAFPAGAGVELIEATVQVVVDFDDTGRPIKRKVRNKWCGPDCIKYYVHHSRSEAIRERQRKMDHEEDNVVKARQAIRDTLHQNYWELFMVLGRFLEQKRTRN